MRLRVWAACLALVCPAAICLAATNPAETVPFDSGWYDYVQELVDEGILEGYPRTHEARVEQTMTRYEFVVAWARFVKWAGIQPTEAEASAADVPADHWARESAEYLAACGILPTEPFRDVDPFHWAAGAVHRLSAEGVGDGGGWSALRGEDPLLRREYVEVLYRTMAAKGGSISRIGGQAFDPAEFVVDEGLFVGYPRTHELHLERPMARLEFCLATARVMEHELFAP